MNPPKAVSEKLKLTWEYQVTMFMHEDDMSEYGADGWELVAVNERQLFWKRPSRQALQSQALEGGHG